MTPICKYMNKIKEKLEQQLEELKVFENAPRFNENNYPARNKPGSGYTELVFTFIILLWNYGQHQE